MISFKLISSLLFYLLCLLTFNHAAKPNAAQKIKLCGDELCSKILFSTRILREIKIDHPSFSKYEASDLIEVFAIRFSDRVDIIEGQVAGKPESRGLLYEGAIDKGPYVEFLRNSIENGYELASVLQDPKPGESKITGMVNAAKDLVRVYNAAAAIFAAEHKLPPPDPMPIPEVNTGNAHGHSHGGHGHSHGGHGHSHGSNDNHGHSHGAGEDSHGHSHGGNDAHSHEPAKAPEPVKEVPAVPQPQDPVVNEANTIVPTDETDDKLLKKYESADEFEKALDEQIRLDMERELLAKGGNKPKPEDGIPVSGGENSVEKELPVESIPTSLPSLPTVENTVTVPPPVETTVAPVVDVPPTPENVLPNVELTTPTPVETPKPVEETTPPPVELPTLTPTEKVEEVPLTTPPVETITLPPLNIGDLKHLHPESTSPPNEIPVEASVDTTAESIPTTTVKPPYEIPPVEIPTTTVPPPVELPTTTVPPPVDNVEPTVVAEEGVCHGDECSHLTGEKQDSTIPPPVDPLAPSPLEDHLASRDFIPSDPSHAENSSHYQPSNSEPGFLSRMVTSLFNVVRSIIPVSDLSDGGVGVVLNILFVITALVIHLVSSLLSDSSDSLSIDRKVSHDLATKVKELTEQLKRKDEELRRHGQQQVSDKSNELNSLRKEYDSVKFENSQLMTRITQLESDIHRLTEDKQHLAEAQTRYNESLNEINERATKYEHELKDKSRQLSDIQQELKETKSAADRLEKDLIAQRSISDKSDKEVQENKHKIEELEQSLEAARNKNQDLITRNEHLDAQCQLLEEMIQNSKKKDGEPAESASSGGSGWSDMEPDFEEDTKKSAPAVTTSIVPNNFADQIVKLRQTQKKLEQEAASTQVALERAVDERNNTQRLYESTKAELDRKLKELDQRDSERIAANEKADKFLKMFETTNAKLDESETNYRKLQEDLNKGREHVMELREEVRRKEERVKELDSELKVMRKDYSRLENKSYYELSDLKRRLEAAQNASVAPAGNNSFEMPAISNNDSFGVEPPMSLQWTTSRDVANISRNRNMSPNDESLGNASLKSAGSRTRRSDRGIRDPSPSDGEKRKEKKDVNRRRSRSTGRVPYQPQASTMPMPYGMYGGYNGYHENYFGEPLDRNVSRSGHLYYSSGGSNGGRSPPPEMPLVTGIAPPGVRRVRSKRATDLGPDLRPS